MPNYNGKKIIITGGAGFIGSHLVDWLLAAGAAVHVLDDLRTGQPKIVEQHKKNKNYRLHRVDITNLDTLKPLFSEADSVFHFAANADIRGGPTNTRIDIEQNTIATYNILEAMRLADVKRICFTSSAAIYGTPSVIPTPESYFPTQTSLYGASKLAGEALIQAFSEYYNYQNWIYRFVSIIGERYPHGVVIDFYRKLKKNPKELEILGDGKQKKSFLYIGDCIKGVMAGVEKGKERTNVFNLGQSYTIQVDRVADIVLEEMGLQGKTKKRFTGGSVGWVGDQPIVHLSTDKIRALGWKPSVEIEDGIRRTIRYLMENEK
jgi:UDP-glucose 4-epimerase